MAELLHAKLKDLPGVSIMFPRQANSVFVQMPEEVAGALRKSGWRFYNFIGRGGCRLMCSWDTTSEDVQRFAQDLKALL
jgi:threonine aldolase